MSNNINTMAGCPNLCSLTWLFLSHNKVTSLQGETFLLHTCSLCPYISQFSQSFENVFITSLSTDKSTGLPLLPALEEIKLGVNKLTSLEGVQRCPNLTWIEAHKNRLPAIPDYPLHHLRRLTLNHNRWEASILAWNTDTSQLQSCVCTSRAAPPSLDRKRSSMSGLEQSNMRQPS